MKNMNQEQWERGRQPLKNLIGTDDERSCQSLEAKKQPVMGGAWGRIAFPAEGRAQEVENGPSGTGWPLGRVRCHGAGIWLYSENYEKSLKSVKNGADMPWWMFFKLHSGQYVENCLRGAEVIEETCKGVNYLKQRWRQGRWREVVRFEKYLADGKERTCWRIGCGGWEWEKGRNQGRLLHFQLEKLGVRWAGCATYRIGKVSEKNMLAGEGVCEGV